jgi:putative oxidoreductase
MSQETETGRSPLQAFYSCADGIAAKQQDAILLVARVLLGWIFVQSGWRKLMDIGAFAQTMSRRGLPDFLGYVAPPVEFLGGLCFLFGFATRYTAVVMLIFLVIATFSSHRYWAADAAQYANQASHFWKNVSMMGGTVLLFVTGAGRYAIDRFLMRK